MPRLKDSVGERDTRDGSKEGLVISGLFNPMLLGPTFQRLQWRHPHARAWRTS